MYNQNDIEGKSPCSNSLNKTNELDNYQQNRSII